MAYYDASKECTPFERSSDAKGHPRPRKGATARKRAKEMASRERLGAEKKAAPAPQKGKKK